MTSLRYADLHAAMPAVRTGRGQARCSSPLLDELLAPGRWGNINSRLSFFGQPVGRDGLRLVRPGTSCLLTRMFRAGTRNTNCIAVVSGSAGRACDWLGPALLHSLCKRIPVGVPGRCIL
jgi:hypothetical protein